MNTEKEITPEIMEDCLMHELCLYSDIDLSRIFIRKIPCPPFKDQESRDNYGAGALEVSLFGHPFIVLHAWDFRDELCCSRVAYFITCTYFLLTKTYGVETVSTDIENRNGRAGT